MTLGDFGARFKQAKAAQAGADEAKPYNFEESYRLRARMLGVLIRDARVSAARTLEDCARLLSVPVEVFEAWELGDDAPDLPQLELLAYFLEIPVSHFWGQDVIAHDPTTATAVKQDYLSLRHRMIGALLRQAREEANLSLAQVAEAAGLSPERLELYELGEMAIPMSELHVLGSAVRRNMDYFVEMSGYIGELLRIREDWKQFQSMDEDVRRFAANPSNLAFLRIAMMFSEMPTEQLRKIAAGLADITM
ncbi:helix-turn-helix transcriptional regulator [Aggregatilineales bacterium SYSU G02658]